MFDILPEPIKFEWDEGNIDKSFKKHGIVGEEAEQMFLNEPLLISKDERHSVEEERYQGLGMTDERKKLFISFTVRNNKVRIISVRLQSRRERIVYAKKEV